MQEIKNIRFSAAIVIIMTISLIAQSAKAAVMIIDGSHQNALQGLLKEQTLSFGGFGVFALLDVKNLDFKNETTNDDINKELEKRARIIDEYFSDRSMPLEGYGQKFVEEAEKYDLDWRLLPALAIRESSGGKYACKNNPFGWASCKVYFDTIDEAIEIVAWNLAGENPNTKQYYEGDIFSKLYHYNGTVINGYEQQVLRIMMKIAGGDIDML